MTRPVTAIFILAGLLPINALAGGLERVKQTIYGMDCAPCAYSVEQGLKALNGVEQVTVSLNDGYAEVHLGEDSQVALGDIREIIRRNGFTSKDANVRVSGKMVRSSDGELLLKTDVETFELNANDPALLSRLSGIGDSSVTVSGSVAPGADSPLSVTAIE